MTPDETRTWWLRAAIGLGSGDDAVGRCHRIAKVQGFVLRHGQVRRAGFEPAALRRLVRQGVWRPLRRGVVTPLSDVPDDLFPAVEASAAALARPGAVVTHRSAAVVHGLPLVLPTPPVPTLTLAHGVRCKATDAVRVHVAELPAADLTRWWGTSVTTVARTVIDVARTDGVRAGLVAADAALHSRLVDLDTVRATLHRQTGWPGVRAARTVVDLADGRAESPLESLGRLLLVGDGLPAPELQQWIATAAGRFRVDGVWRRERVVVEFDGLVKYDRPGSLTDEKLRQEALERAGWVVVRITWEDVHVRPGETVERVRRALRRGAARAA